MSMRSVSFRAPISVAEREVADSHRAVLGRVCTRIYNSRNYKVIDELLSTSRYIRLAVTIELEPPVSIRAPTRIIVYFVRVFRLSSLCRPCQPRFLHYRSNLLLTFDPQI